MESDFTGDNMKKELSLKYLVIKLEDIENKLNIHEQYFFWKFVHKMWDEK